VIILLSAHSVGTCIHVRQVLPLRRCSQPGRAHPRTRLDTCGGWKHGSYYLVVWWTLARDIGWQIQIYPFTSLSRILRTVCSLNVPGTLPTLQPIANLESYHRTVAPFRLSIIGVSRIRVVAHFKAFHDPYNTSCLSLPTRSLLLLLSRNGTFSPSFFSMTRQHTTRSPLTKPSSSLHPEHPSDLSMDRSRR